MRASRAKEIIRSHMDEVEKEKVTSAEIISREIDGKPYYEIKFKKVGEDEYTIGYSSFKLDYVVKWLNDYFECAGEAEVSCENGGWIPVDEKLPEVGEIVEVTVHSSEWIADYSSGWVPEEEKTYHAEEHNVYYGYLNSERQWVFCDDENSENICEKEFGTDKGRVYDVVTAWRIKPEPYIKNPK